MQNGETPCPICRVVGAKIDEEGVHYNVNCQLCGHFRMTESAFAETPYQEKSRRHLLSGVLRNVWVLTQNMFTISSKHLESWDQVLKAVSFGIPADLDVNEKATAVLRYLRHKSSHLGFFIVVDEKVDFPIGYCQNRREFRFLLDFMLQRAWVKEDMRAPETGTSQITITPVGWAYWSGVDADVTDVGFVAMSFNHKWDDVWLKGLKPGIAGAGYKPERMDAKETINKIDDEIIAGIRRARFLVADLSEQNAGAYFEAGFAMGLGRPVVWTCEGRMIDVPKHIHFDTRQYSIVPWEKDQYDEFAVRLTNRIEATIGRGQYKAL